MSEPLLTKPTIDLLGIDVCEDDVQPFVDWLKDPRGSYFWRWLKQRAVAEHDRSSKPPEQIMELVTSQRHLAAENAYDCSANYRRDVLDIIKHLSLTSQSSH